MLAKLPFRCSRIGLAGILQLLHYGEEKSYKITQNLDLRE